MTLLLFVRGSIEKYVSQLLTLFHFQDYQQFQNINLTYSIFSITVN